MKNKQQMVRFVVAGVVILGTVIYLAVSGASESKSYYVTIGELQKMVHDSGDKAYKRNLRVAGNVKGGSIHHVGTHADFVLVEQGKELSVSYNGTEPPPDTFFKEDAQALAMGKYGRDGVFHANQLQAKCASKYAPAKPSDTAAPKPPNTVAAVR
ncbi:MAG: cytochrome c maturation protein CcmE [Acidobacteria bacterium]|nr:cytochrome c maturation protein CcmE [Acidobacteriota bacterium]